LNTCVRGGRGGTGIGIANAIAGVSFPVSGFSPAKEMNDKSKSRNNNLGLELNRMREK